MFVCFQKDTGKIDQITNELPNQEINYIEVQSNEVTSILSGEENISSYIVEFDPLENMLKLRHRNNLTKVYIDIKKAIYKVPFVNLDPDLEIIQDFDNTCWKFLLGNTLKSNMKLGGVNYNTNLYFSVTKSNDPNILFRTLKVNVRELIQNRFYILPFEMEFETNGNSVSIFTEKLFNKYKFTRIRNGKEI